jgi:uncharacterized protein YhbP (UPF0306 family)
MDIEQKIREYLPDILHMSLATSAGNKPWVCEVHFAYDKDLNLYFRSKPDRRHSQELAKNPNVAGNIITQHAAEQKPRGVYFEGTAKIVQDIDEDHPAYKSFEQRLGVGPEILEDAKKDDGHKIYKISVSNYYLFDSRESSPSRKYHLPWKVKNQ